MILFDRPAQQVFHTFLNELMELETESKAANLPRQKTRLLCSMISESSKVSDQDERLIKKRTTYCKKHSLMTVRHLIFSRYTSCLIVVEYDVAWFVEQIDNA